ncbi:MAG: FecR family protein [Marinifilaceae bacterium]
MTEDNRTDNLLEIYKQVRKIDTAVGLQQVERRIKAKQRRKVFIRTLSVAACCATISIGVMLSLRQSQPQEVINHVSLKQSNGAVIDLTSMETCPIEGGVIEGKNEIRFVESAISPSEVEYSEIRTPIGAEYKITLADGTIIWMNSCSSVQFANNFSTSSVREIKLSGEIFIDVATDSLRPFIVKMGSTHVEVYGTKLNISSNSDKNSIQATLVEGSAAVVAKNKNYPLAPGLQFRMQDNDCEVTEANLSQILAWRNNVFLFDDQRFEDVIEQLERWYPVTFIFVNNKLRNIEFKGNIPRTATLDELLDYLMLCCDAHFTRKEALIYID